MQINLSPSAALEVSRILQEALYQGSNFNSELIDEALSTILDELDNEAERQHLDRTTNSGA